MEPLLTVEEVATLLNISPRTVYDHAREMGGFYPFGIKTLRFRREVICGDLERQGPGALAVPISVRREGHNRAWVQHASRSRSRKSKEAGRITNGILKTDPSRHGL